MSLYDDPNFVIFRECLFNTILERLHQHGSKKPRKSRRRVNPTDEELTNVEPARADTPDQADELTDFSDFLALELFPSLPSELQTISYQVLQDEVQQSDKWSLPLSLSTHEEIAEHVPPAVTDSLSAYSLIEPPKHDLQSFLSPVVVAYITATTAPPPRWIDTKVTTCEICERDWVPMTYHHLIPKAVHAKALKRGWHEEQQLNSVAWLCRACHTFVHRMASNEELAKDYYTVDKIWARNDVQKWANWVGKVRWKKK